RGTADASVHYSPERRHRRGSSALAEGFFLVPRSGDDAGGGVPPVLDCAEGGEERTSHHADLPAESSGTLRPLRSPDPVAQQRGEGGHDSTERPREVVLGRGAVSLAREGRGPPGRRRIPGDEQQLPDGLASRAVDPRSGRR